MKESVEMWSLRDPLGSVVMNFKWIFQHVLHSYPSSLYRYGVAGELHSTKVGVCSAGTRK